MTKINILGAGQTSMLAAIMLAKRGYRPTIIDNKPLKQSHFALLRFGSDQIEQETGIKLEEVQIKKAIYFGEQIYNESNIKFDNLYSQKVTGKIQKRSIGNLGVGKRWTPPVDFFQQLEQKCKEYNIEVRQEEDLMKYFGDEGRTISTLPMPKIYKNVCSEDIKFDFESITVVEFNVDNCNVHQTIYYPEISESSPAYRISVVGNNIKCEISEKSLMQFCYFDEEWNNKTTKFELFLFNLSAQIEKSFGIKIPLETVEDLIQQCLSEGCDSVIKEQKFGKISPINEQKRQQIIYNLTSELNVYSLGRFSCWRQIMMDDVVNDVKKIDKLIKLSNINSYEANKDMASRL